MRNKCTRDKQCVAYISREDEAGNQLVNSKPDLFGGVIVDIETSGCDVQLRIDRDRRALNLGDLMFRTERAP